MEDAVRGNVLQATNTAVHVVLEVLSKALTPKTERILPIANMFKITNWLNMVK